MIDLNGIRDISTQIDSFQDPAVTITAKRQKLTPFKTLVFTLEIDPFQDPVKQRIRQNVKIDSFQDPYVLHWN